MNARKTLTYLILFVVLLALPTVARRLHFYGNPIDREEVVRPDVSKIEMSTPPASIYADEQVVAGDGVVVVDLAHDNQLQLVELNVLAGRLAARGHQLKTWTGGDLEAELREASALLVAVPLSPFEKDEIEIVRDFVESGGRLLLLGDPTRFGYVTDDWGWIIGIDSDARYLSSLGTPFGVAFVDDYLYNVADNEGNFRNIKLSDWGEGDFGEGLDTVVFYATHSLAVAEEAAVIRADNETWSSATDRAGGLVVAAQTAEGRVLALGDMTFMTEPYHTVRDNSELIARIADFLTGAVRSYKLNDFPLFYGSEVSLAFTNNPELGPGQLQLVDDLQEVFEETDQNLLLLEQPAERTDALYLGIYSQYEPITPLLKLHGITLTLTSTLELDEELDDLSAEEEDDLSVEETEVEDEEADETEEDEEPESTEPEGLVTIENLGSYDMSGIALLLVHEGDGYTVLVVLAASQDGLGNIVERLPAGDLYDCVSAEAVTLCPTGIAEEEVEMDWVPLEPVEAEEEPEDEEEEVDEGEEEVEPEGIQGELEYGDSVTGALAEEEEHLWVFTGTAGDVVDIFGETEVLDLVLVLEDPDGEELIAADENLSSAGESIVDYSLPSNGEYTIRVRDFWGTEGEYTLTLNLVSSGDGEETGDTGDEEEGVSGGVIDFGETVQGVLGEDEQGVWTFDGAADQAITIIAQPNNEEGDLILRLEDEAGDTLIQVDDAFGGEEERIEGVLPQDGEYSIIVQEWYGDPVSYTLSLEEGGEGPLFGGRGILVVSADDGEPLLDGDTGADVYLEVLGDDYDVTLWTLSTDGEISIEDMQDYELIIWTSGDFQGDEFTQLTPFLAMGEGKPLLMSGATLGMLSDGETAPIVDVEIPEVDTVLTQGLVAGEVYELAQEIEAVVFEFEEDDGIPVLLRGPASEVAGDSIAAAIEEETDNLRLMLIGIPIYLLPESLQTQIILNAVEWFGVEPIE